MALQRSAQCVLKSCLGSVELINMLTSRRDRYLRLFGFCIWLQWKRQCHAWLSTAQGPMMFIVFSEAVCCVCTALGWQETIPEPLNHPERRRPVADESACCVLAQARPTDSRLPLEASPISPWGSQGHHSPQLPVHPFSPASPLPTHVHQLGSALCLPRTKGVYFYPWGAVVHLNAFVSLQ